MMVPLDPAAIPFVRSWLGRAESPGLLALHHALTYQRPGLWGDVPGTPRSVILVREGLSGLEAFGVGRPEPAVGWLIGRRREFTLHASDDWIDVARERLGTVEMLAVETWAGPGLIGGELRARTSDRSAPSSRSTSGRGTSPAGAGAATAAGPITRPLHDADATNVTALLPPWALRGWRSCQALFDHGAAFGVPYEDSFASIAWIFDRADQYESVGVFTSPRFRRLGLGRAAARALIEHIVLDRRRIPLWSTTLENEASRTLARSLGFSVVNEESLARWPPGVAAS